jgi:hypothetical protein
MVSDYGAYQRAMSGRDQGDETPEQPDGLTAEQREHLAFERYVRRDEIRAQGRVEDLDE